jgi:peptidoglycan/LPS O-acetylase OafA/YrhL
MVMTVGENPLLQRKPRVHALSKDSVPSMQIGRPGRFDFVDGLRALAALAIVAFHINDYRIPGGFVGVDVFFVISGFLITGQLSRSIDEGRFSLGEFYARRIRRLLPALLVVVLFSYVVAMTVLLPSELVAFSWSLLSSVTYVSNIYFYQNSGYFDSDAATSPLLHTWSLSVEEQFYLAFPLIFIAVARFCPRYRFQAMVLLGALSLVGTELLLDDDSSAAFYLSPFRAWEFALGGVVALWHGRWRGHGLIAEFLALASLAVICLSFLLMNDTLHFPGIGAFPVTAATAVIIFLCTRMTLITGSLLSFSPLAAVGRSSYSLYLWHWPIIVFYRIQFNAEPGLIEQVGLLACCLIVAGLSYRFIEQPFLRIEIPRQSLRVVVQTIGVSAVVALLAVPTLLSGGLPNRFNEQQLHFARYLGASTEAENGSGECFLAESHMRFANYPKDQCLPTDPNRKNVLLLGDSHAAHFITALRQRYPDINFAQANASGCQPTLRPEGARRCVRLLDYIYSTVVPSRRFDAVILAARWRDSDVPHLRETAEFLAQNVAEVFMVGPTIEYAVALPRLLATRSQIQDRDLHYEEIEQRDRAIREAVYGTATFLSVFDSLCSKGKCVNVTSEGVPLSYDYGHFTQEGAALVIDRLREQGLFAS